MCGSCKLAAMMEMPENPNPQEGRTYPKGWDLAGFFSPSPLPGVVGYEADDTLRVVYMDPRLCLYHLQLAEAFSGARMELFFDGSFFCYRPAIVKRGKVQPPAWHVMQEEEEEEISEEDEIRARMEFESMLREAGVDPREVFGDIRDDLPEGLDEDD